MASAEPPRPMVVWANYHPFAAGEEITNRGVESRTLLWCTHGTGTIVSDDVEFTIERNSLLVTTWGGVVRFCPDESKPFRLGVVHLIPDLPPGTPIRFDVATDDISYDEVFAVRRDHPCLPAEPILVELAEDRPLLRLLDYSIAVFERPAWRSEQNMRSLGRFILDELISFDQDVQATRRGLPPPLTAAMKYIDMHMTSIPSMEELCKASDCSRSTLHRHFMQHLGSSPQRWQLQRRMDKAQRLLADTGYDIDRIAAMVGYSSRSHFSNAFRRLIGVSPKSWRRQHRGHGPDHIEDLA